MRSVNGWDGGRFLLPLRFVMSLGVWLVRRIFWLFFEEKRKGGGAVYVAFFDSSGWVRRLDWFSSYTVHSRLMCSMLGLPILSEWST